VVVVLSNPFREVGARRNSTETQQSGHGWSQIVVLNGRTRIRFAEIKYYTINTNAVIVI